MTRSSAIAKRYLAAIREHDWDSIRHLLHDDIIRIGPFSDVVRGVENYVEFLAKIVPSLPGYEMIVTRVAETADGAVVELSETIVEDGVPKRTAEALVLDIEDGRIRRIAIYIQSLVELTRGPMSL